MAMHIKRITYVQTAKVLKRNYCFIYVSDTYKQLIFSEMKQIQGHGMLYFLLLMPYIYSASVYNIGNDDLDDFVSERLNNSPGKQFLKFQSFCYHQDLNILFLNYLTIYTDL